MLKSKEDILVDQIFRSTYGQDYTWDSDSQALAYRRGAGRLQDGPTKPKVTVPTGQVTDLSPKQAVIPTAVAASSVAPASLSASVGDDDAVKRAILKARAYIKGN